jgi:signal peptide peptidase SppA
MRFLTNGLSGREPLLIDPAKAKDHAVLAEKFGFTDMLAQLFGVAPKPYVTADGIGVIPIVGVIGGPRLSPMEKMMGAVDVADISSAIDAFAMEPSVHQIAFNISSPGGTVTGVEELANKIRNLDKPTMSYTDSEMASAAYWIGSQADRVVASPSATVGSVGVYMAIPDMTKLYETQGVRMVVIKSTGSPLKGAGIEGTSLSEEQMAELQSSVDSIHADFKAAIQSKRTMVADSALRGQTFSGKQAAAQGLVTGLADSFSQALNMFADNSIAPAPSVLPKK